MSKFDKLKRWYHNGYLEGLKGFLISSPKQVEKKCFTAYERGYLDGEIDRQITEDKPWDDP